jgi:hypothetical protein
MKLGDLFPSSMSISAPSAEHPTVQTPIASEAFSYDPAVAFLLSRLGHGPRLIADLIAEWCGGSEVRQRDGLFRWEGGRDGTNGQWIRDLNDAREVLGVIAYEGHDGRLWWKFPHEKEQ